MNKFQGKTAQLTLGAALLAVFIILHIIIPGGQKVVQGVLMVLTFLPVTVYALCCGTKKALVMAAAGAALCALLLPMEVLLSYAIPALLIGIVGGMCYGKRKRLTVILLLSVLQLLQNVVELFVYYLLMEVDFLETYQWAVGLVYERIPAQWLEIPMFNRFLEDFIVSAMPCVAILGAGAKGYISFHLIRLLSTRLHSVMHVELDHGSTELTKFPGGISIAYLCAEVLCVVIALLPFLGLVPYHFICAAAGAMAVLLAVLYFFYFYSIRVRTQEEHQTRLMYSLAMVALLPINIFALPLLELHLLKKENTASEVTHQ